jgi:hypothetical protein
MMPENQKPKENKFGFNKVATAAGGGATLIAIAGVLNAFFNGGGLELIKPFINQITNQKEQSPQSSATSQPSSPENSASPPTQIAQTPGSGENSSAASSSPASATPSSDAPKSNISDPQTFEKSGFLFESKGCTREGAEVQCNLSITSQTGDRPLILRGNTQREKELLGSDPDAAVFQGVKPDEWYYYVDKGYSRLITPDGSQYVAQDISLVGNEKKSETYIQETFPQKVPVKTKLTFLGVPQKETQLSLVELSVQSALSKLHNPNQTTFQVQFRKVPIIGSN